MKVNGTPEANSADVEHMALDVALSKCFRKQLRYLK